MKNFENMVLSDYVSIMRRRIWYVIGTAGLVSAIALGYTLQMRPSYISETTIFVAGRLVPEAYVDSIVRDTAPERIEFVRQQLQSRTFLQKIVQEFQLAGPASGTEVESVINAVRARTVLTSLNTTAFRLSFTAPDPALAQAVTRRLADRVIQLNDTFRKERVYGTGQFMDEQFRQASETLAKVEEKLRQFYALHFPGIPRDGINVDSLAMLQVQLSAADGNLQTLSDRRKAVERQIEDQKQMKALARAPTPQVQPAPSADRDVIIPSAPTLLEQQLAVKRAELSEKSTRYTALHPEVIVLTQEVKELEGQVSQERQRAARPAAPRTTADNRTLPVPSLPEIDSSDFRQAELKLELERISRDVAAADQVKRQAASKMALFQSRINPPADVAHELNELNREYEDAKQQYTDISVKKNRAGLASDADTNGENQVFKIVDEANLPQHPFGPGRRIVAIGGGMLGLFLGLAAAFGRELLDSSVLDEQQAAAEFKIAVLTSIPEIAEGPKVGARQKDGKTGGSAVLGLKREETLGEGFDLQTMDKQVEGVIGNPMSLAGEHFRLLRAKLAAMQKTVGLKSLIVTSAIPNEGKTFSAVCLAGIMAQEPGKRVLLIDADLRSGKASSVLGVGRRSTGLTGMLLNVPTSRAEFLQRGLVKYNEADWYFLPVGPVVKNPAELLSTPAFESLMRLAQEEFDWVIVDSPPVLAVSDTNLLAPVCDATVFVMYAGKTPSARVKEAIGRIGPERICGLVMNRARNLETNKYHAYYQKQSMMQ